VFKNAIAVAQIDIGQSGVTVSETRLDASAAVAVCSSTGCAVGGGVGVTVEGAPGDGVGEGVLTGLRSSRGCAPGVTEGVGITVGGIAADPPRATGTAPIVPGGGVDVGSIGCTGGSITSNVVVHDTT
jgi:hypothetical protein